MPTRSLMLAAVVTLALAAPPARAAITFSATPYDLGQGSHPQSVALADLDAVNGLDIVVAEPSAGSVAVLLNNGDGTFMEALHYPACAGAADVVAGPIDADFDIDVAVRCGDGSVALLPGAGTGELGPADVQAGMLADRELTLAELTGGGPREIVYSAAGPGGPELCWSSYAGTNWTGPECGDHPPSADYTPIAGDIAAADLSDPPGSPPRDEVITGDFADVGNILFWGRNSNDGFASWTHSTRGTGDTSPVSNAAPPAIVTTDLQADGDADVVAAHVGSPGGLAVFLWGEHGIPTGVGAQYPSLADVTTGGAGDFDGDRLPDVAVAGESGHGMAHRGRANGTLGAGQSFLTPGGTSVDMAVGDVTGDRKADIVMTAAGAHTVSVLKATGKAKKHVVKPPAPGRKGVSGVPKTIRVMPGKLVVGHAKNPPTTRTTQKLFAPHHVLVGKGTTFVPPGKRGTAMKVKLTKKGRHAVKRLGELRVKLRVVARGVTGKPSTLRRHITLKFPS